MESYRRLSGFFILVITAINFVHLQAYSEGLRSESRDDKFYLIKTPVAEEKSTKMLEQKTRAVASDAEPVEVQVESAEGSEDVKIRTAVIENRNLASEPAVKEEEKRNTATAVEEEKKSSAASTVESSNAKKEKKELFYKCTKQREYRWIRLHYLENGRCRTVYSKTGNAQEVSTAYSYESCEAVLKNIKDNLEKGGYQCEEKVLVGALEIE